jgi:hypothetical protein
MKRTLIFLSLLLILATTAFSQVNVGANIQTSYTFRGATYCPNPVIGGSLEYIYKSLSVSTGVTTSIKGDFSENCVNVKFFKDTVWYLQLTDYYYPYTTASFGTFSGRNAGSHCPELSGSYTYKGFGLLLSTIIYNDTTYSPYAQLSYAWKVEEGQFNLFAGTTFGNSYFYNTVGTGIKPIFVGISYKKDKVGLTYYVNPTADLNRIVVAYDL